MMGTVDAFVAELKLPEWRAISARVRPRFAATVFALAALAGTEGVGYAESPNGADSLYAARMARYDEHALSTDLFVAWGATSVAAGGALALSGVGGTRGRAASLVSVAWGAVDLALGVPELLALAKQRRDIEDERILAGSGAARERAIAHEYEAATSFAFLLGTDLVAVSAGALLWHYAGREGQETLAGVGVAAVIQGGVLALFDASNLVLSLGGAHRLLALPLMLSPSVNREGASLHLSSHF